MASKEPVQGIPIMIDGKELIRTFLDAADTIQGKIRTDEERLAGWKADAAKAREVLQRMEQEHDDALEPLWQEAVAKYDEDERQYTAWHNAYKAELAARKKHGFWWRLVFRPKVPYKEWKGIGLRPNKDALEGFITANVPTLYAIGVQRSQVRKFESWVTDTQNTLAALRMQYDYYQYRAAHIPAGATFHITDEEFAKFGIHPAMKGAPMLTARKGDQ